MDIKAYFYYHHHMLQRITLHNIELKTEHISSLLMCELALNLQNAIFEFLQQIIALPTLQLTNHLTLYQFQNKQVIF